MEVMFLLAIAALAVCVTGDGHGHSASGSDCQRRLEECTRTFGQSGMTRQSLQYYLDCLEPIDCSSNTEDTNAYDKMVTEVAWRLANYDEYFYDRKSDGSSLRHESTCLPSVLVIGWIVTRALCKH